MVETGEAGTEAEAEAVGEGGGGVDIVLMSRIRDLEF